jgi:hypothetical protein
MPAMKKLVILLPALFVLLSSCTTVVEPEPASVTRETTTVETGYPAVSRSTTTVVSP